MTTTNPWHGAYDALRRGGTATASGLLVGAGLKRTWANFNGNGQAVSTSVRSGPVSVVT